ncbi:MAG: MopE-related protein [Sandaracinaceae bacterium]
MASLRIPARSLGLVVPVLGLAVSLAAAGCGRSSVLVPSPGLDGGPPDGALPDDGVACSSDGECDDGLACNGEERCGADGRCRAGMAPTCDDGIPCTRDACEEPGGCASTPDSGLCPPGQVCVPGVGCEQVPCMGDGECDDGSVCNGAERCLGGFCTPGVPLVCDSPTPCLVGRCVEPTGCELTERDDDGDGFVPIGCPSGTDCNDEDARINPDADEVCTDGDDNDCNGDADCDDLVCAGEPICGLCDSRDLGSMTGIAVATGSTDARPDRLSPSCALGSTAGEQAFRWTAPATGRWRFSTLGSTFDTVLYVLTACPSGAELGCNDDTLGASSRVDLNVVARQEVTLVVDGSGDDEGRYQLNIERLRPPEDCDDGRDNDGDGLVDCDDPDCATDPSCCRPLLEVCDDGRDQDCDGLVDCEDPDCVAAPDCCVPTPELCDDGRDQDCDGLIDCLDPNCAAAPACCVPAPELCADGLDQDCDGLVDCDDPDCAGELVCVCPEQDLGSALGVVSRGTTVGQGDDTTPGCRAGSTAEDISFSWRAPFGGEYLIDTNGSMYDTVLYVLDECAGPELVCDDDGGTGTDSEVRIRLRAGQEVVIVVDGFGASSGRYVLNIAALITGEFLCNDMVDNDVDGFIDCADSDCAGVPPCP